MGHSSKRRTTYLELTLLEHFSEVVDSSSGLLGQSANARNVLWVLLVNEVGEITSIVENHVQGLTIGEDQSLKNSFHLKDIYIFFGSIRR